MDARFCPCGSTKNYADCCAPYIEHGVLPSTAEALMRSRYTAYTRLNEGYLLATWHPSTRPSALGLADEAKTQWLGLQVKRHESSHEQAVVEFVARYKVNGKAHRLHEVSQFVREEGRWFYVNGVVE
jgi:SEC-C motif-containing protein